MKTKTVILILSLLLTITTLSGCSNKQNLSNKTQEDNQVFEENSISKIETGTNKALTYSNLNSKASMNEIKSIFNDSGIENKSVDTVLEWVNDYNAAMKNCEAFSLVGDFTVLQDKTVYYSDYPTISRAWFRKNNRNYFDVLCRIVAFELNKGNITINKTLSRENFACWSEEGSWLYSDGVAIFGREAVEGDYPKSEPFPLLDWNDEEIKKYFTLFNPIEIKENCTEEDMYEAINKHFEDYGISFKENSYSLIGFWIQSGNQISMSHSATLFETENGFLLFEKVNPEEPYVAVNFSNTDEIKTYLYERIKLEDEEYGDEITDKYVITRNNKIM